MTALGHLLLNVSVAGAAVGIARLLHVCAGLRRAGLARIGRRV